MPRLISFQIIRRSQPPLYLLDFSHGGRIYFPLPWTDQGRPSVLLAWDYRDADAVRRKTANRFHSLVKNSFQSDVAILVLAACCSSMHLTERAPPGCCRGSGAAILCKRTRVRRPASLSQATRWTGPLTHYRSNSGISARCKKAEPEVARVRESRSRLAAQRRDSITA